MSEFLDSVNKLQLCHLVVIGMSTLMEIMKEKLHNFVYIITAHKYMIQFMLINYAKSEDLHCTLCTSSSTDVGIIHSAKIRKLDKG